MENNWGNFQFLSIGIIDRRERTIERTSVLTMIYCTKISFRKTKKAANMWSNRAHQETTMVNHSLPMGSNGTQLGYPPRNKRQIPTNKEALQVFFTGQMGDRLRSWLEVLREQLTCSGGKHHQAQSARWSSWWWWYSQMTAVTAHALSVVTCIWSNLFLRYSDLNVTMTTTKKSERKSLNGKSL